MSDALPIALKHQRQVRCRGLSHRLAVIQHLQQYQLFLMLLDQVSQLVQQAATLEAAQLGPFTTVEGRASCSDGCVD